MKIIPGILAKSPKEFRERINSLKWAKKIHIDIMDGKFVPNKTIQAETIKRAMPKQDMQIHLMSYMPEKQVEKFAKLGAKEFIFHAEATSKQTELLEKIKTTGMKAGIAYAPLTRINKNVVRHADISLVMSVQPGFSEQRLAQKPLSKIAEIKKCNPLIVVGVDGGVNLQTCGFVCRKGADFAIATTAVTAASNSRKAYEQMKKCR